MIVLPCLFSPPLSAAEQQNVTDSEDRPNQPLDEYEADQGRKKPFDLGLGLSIGSGLGLSMFGSDVILGKRLVNNRDWVNFILPTGSMVISEYIYSIITISLPPVALIRFGLCRC